MEEKLITEKFLISLKELMEERGILNLEQLSKRIGIASAVVYRWKDGKIPDLKSLKTLSDFFGASLDFLLGMSEYPDLRRREVPLNFRIRYRELKKEKSLKDYDIAKKCKVGSGTPTRWNQGRLPDTFYFILLCEVFNCGVEYLMGLSDY